MINLSLSLSICKTDRVWEKRGRKIASVRRDKRAINSKQILISQVVVEKTSSHLQIFDVENRDQNEMAGHPPNGAI